MNYDEVNVHTATKEFLMHWDVPIEQWDQVLAERDQLWDALSDALYPIEMRIFHGEAVAADLNKLAENFLRRLQTLGQFSESTKYVFAFELGMNICNMHKQGYQAHLKGEGVTGFIQNLLKRKHNTDA